jgi:FixJ family two-component response regulator
MDNSEQFFILVIDDDIEIHSILKIMMDFWGFTTISALNAYEGIAAAVKYQPLFIILDIDMPEINGEKTLRLLKEIELTHNIPVLILSGSIDKNIILFTKKYGAADFITKPFSHEMFLTRILDVLPENVINFLKLKPIPKKK